MVTIDPKIGRSETGEGAAPIGAMNNSIAKVLIAFTVVTSLSLISLTAMAQDSNFNDRIAMAYAPENEADQSQFDQFDQFELHGAYEDAHELNDAWLGMPVRDAAGKVVGHVQDAFLDAQGGLTELLVSLKGSKVAVYVDQKNVEYTQVAVLVDLPLQMIASLEQEKDFRVE